MLNLEFNLRDVSYSPTLFTLRFSIQKSDPIRSIRLGMGHSRGCLELILGKARTDGVFEVLRFFGVSRDRVVGMG